MGHTLSTFILNTTSPSPPQDGSLPSVIQTISEPDPSPDVLQTSGRCIQQIPDILVTTPATLPDTTICSPNVLTDSANTNISKSSPAGSEVSEPVSHTSSLDFSNQVLQSALSSNSREFIRQVHERNNCSGEAFEDITNNEGERIKQMILNYLPYVNITRVCVVKNSFLMGMYQLKKAEYKSRYKSYTVRELTMFHATDAANVESIIQNNLDWRRVYRNKYGAGVSFSRDADYCNFHCTPKNGPRRVFIVASVLVCRESEGYRYMVRPSDRDVDTAVGYNHTVYVKFNDNEFLPRYLVFYDSPDRTRSRYWVRRY